MKTPHVSISCDCSVIDSIPSQKLNLNCFSFHLSQSNWARRWHQSNHFLCWSLILPIDQLWKIDGPVNSKNCYSSMFLDTVTPYGLRGRQRSDMLLFNMNHFQTWKTAAAPFLTCLIWWSLVLGTRMGDEGTCKGGCAWTEHSILNN